MALEDQVVVEEQLIYLIQQEQVEQVMLEALQFQKVIQEEQVKHLQVHQTAH